MKLSVFVCVRGKESESVWMSVYDGIREKESQRGRDRVCVCVCVCVCDRERESNRST